MHPILIIAIAVPIAVGAWMVLRGLRAASREQRLSVIKWIIILGLFVLSAYLAWTGLWRHALGVLGSMLLFLWNWRGLLGWMASRAILRRRMGQMRGQQPSAASDMRPARTPGDAAAQTTEPPELMGREEAMEILGLRPGYSEADVNQAWEDMLRTFQEAPDQESVHPDAGQVNGFKPKAPKPFINAIHEARTVLLEDLK